MKIQVDEAILLDVKDESFTGRDGTVVKYRKARFIDDENEYHEASVAKDVDFEDDLENIARWDIGLTFTIEERNGKLKKQVVEIAR
jgi:hypothetical protein